MNLEINEENKFSGEMFYIVRTSKPKEDLKVLSERMKTFFDCYGLNTAGRINVYRSLCLLDEKMKVDSDIVLIAPDDSECPNALHKIERVYSLEETAKSGLLLESDPEFVFINIEGVGYLVRYNPVKPKKILNSK